MTKNGSTNNNNNINQDNEYYTVKKMVESESQVKESMCVLECKVPTYQNQMLIIPLN